MLRVADRGLREGMLRRLSRKLQELDMKQGDASGRGRVPVKVKKDRGRTASSRAWLQRQLNDPYVAAARAKGYRSRAAFKLLELDEKFHFLKKGAKVLDLGAAPGGWSQVAAARGATVVAADVLEMEPIPGVTFFQADLTDPDVPGDAESRRWTVPPIWC